LGYTIPVARRFNSKGSRWVPAGFLSGPGRVPEAGFRSRFARSGFASSRFAHCVRGAACGARLRASAGGGCGPHGEKMLGSVRIAPAESLPPPKAPAPCR